jgi:hypothetical protein
MMAEPEIVVASEIEDNPEASNHESQVEGMHPNPGQLVQAIVAFRGYCGLSRLLWPFKALFPCYPQQYCRISAHS